MAIYNHIGEQLNGANTYQGNMLDVAYNYVGDEVFRRSSSWSMRVMSYNVQKFTGINTQQQMQDLIISTYNADVIGVQEWGNSSAIPSIAAEMFADYDYLNFSRHLNYLCVVSKRPLTDITVADFEHQDPEDISRWNERRAYIKGYFNINGNRVCFINTHLCYLTESVKWQQMGEIFSIAQQENNCIITGDFNNYSASVEDGDYINMFKPFYDAGYKLLNCSPSAGFTKTYSNQATASSLEDLLHATDSIIVSPNLTISNIVYDTTKFSYPNGYAIDHIPIICDVSYDDDTTTN